MLYDRVGFIGASSGNEELQCELSEGGGTYEGDCLRIKVIRGHKPVFPFYNSTKKYKQEQKIYTPV